MSPTNRTEMSPPAVVSDENHEVEPSATSLLCRAGEQLLDSGLGQPDRTSRNGPIRGWEDVSRYCVPPESVPDFRHSALGVPLPEDRPPSLTIDTVELVNPDGITMGTPYLIPVHQNPDGEYTTLGLEPFPPTENLPQEWEQAAPAIGDPVPTDTPQTVAVELRLDDGRDRGSVDGVRITYTVNRRHYQAVFNVGAGLGNCENDESADEADV